MILALALTLFPLGNKAALAGTASAFRPFIPAQQWFFESPKAVAVDGSDIYVGTSAGDISPYQITKVSSTGELLESWGIQGSENGQIDELTDIAVDGDGNVYVADSGNNRVQKFSSAGDFIMMLESSGNAEYPMSPRGVAADSDGNIYVTYETDNRVEKFDSSGQVDSDWWNQAAGDYQFSQPTDIAVDKDGNVYVADTDMGRIVQFTSAGDLLLMFGEEDEDGEDQLIEPIGVAVDSSGNVYAVDAHTKQILKFNASGNLLLNWGGEGRDDDQFDDPCSIAVDSGDQIYVADSENNRIQKFASSGDFLKKWGRGGSADGEFSLPFGIARDSEGNIYVSDTTNNRIEKFDSTGAFVTTWGSFGKDNHQLDMPMGIVVDPDDNVYVADMNNNRIQKFDASGGYLATIESSEETDLSINKPMGLAADGSGIFVTELMNHRVQKFASSGASLGTLGGTDPGTGPGEFAAPGSVAVDSAGNIYVLDTQNSRVQKFREFSAEGFEREWGSFGSEDGQFINPNGIAVDSAGNVYVSDGGNYRIQKFSSSGEFLEKWGSPGVDAGQFLMPGSVMVDGNNSIYVVDSGNNRIQKLGGTAPIRYRVTFDSNGGSTVAAIGDIAANGTVTLPAAPTKAGFTFAGWYTDNGAFAHGFTSSTPVTGNITVYAKWTAVPAPSGFIPIIPNGQWFFDVPRAAAVDSSSNIYIVDSNRHQIKKLSSMGEILATWGSYGNENGQMNVPGHIALDSEDNVYVADTGNNRIQKFSSTGEYLMKFGSSGSGEGQFRNPKSVTVDSAGNIYVADTTNKRIQKFDSDGAFILEWETSPASGDYQLNQLTDIAVDIHDYVYVVDANDQRVHKFTSAGVYVGAIGGPGGTGDPLNLPLGLTVDQEGYIYVADALNYQIQKYSAEGEFLAKWGSQGVGNVQFGAPQDVATDSSGNVYVVDSGNKRIQKFDSSGSFLKKWGSNGSDQGEFNRPQGIAVDSEGNIYVADSNNHRIQKFNAAGAFMTTWGSFGTELGQFNSPKGIAVDSNGNVYVADVENDRVQKFDSMGGNPQGFGSTGTDEGEFKKPSGVAVDSDGNIYVVEAMNHRMQKFDSAFQPQYTWGGTGYGNGDGQFNSPSGVTVDSSGNIYVLDNNNNRVQKFDANGEFVLKWGSPGAGDSQFLFPHGIAVDSAGNVYVADTSANWIRKYTPEGTLLAKWGTRGNSAGQFDNPYGIAADSAGNVYVADTNNNRIQKLAPAYTVTFDSNGGSPVAAISNVTANATVTLPAAPTKEGYTFAGWYTDNGVFAQAFTAATPVTGNLTVYAKWTAASATHTVTFDSNGGSPVVAISNVTANATVTLPVAPTKEGYTFAGWYTDNGVFAQAFTASTPVTGSITVYAKWTAASATHTVTFNSNGGSPVAAISNVTANATVTLPAAPTKEGYTFAGWYTDNGVFAQAFTASTPVTADLTVYAKWTRNSSGGNDGGGGSGGSTSTPTPATVTGNVKNSSNGSTVANITAAVTRDSKNRLTLTMPADQLVVVKQPNGTTTPLIDDVSKVSIVGENGTALTVSAKGTLQVSGLAQGTDHTYTISYDFGKGQKINLGTLAIKIDKKGNVSELTVTLIDPYGILTDGATGEVIAGAQVTLYYADTARNKAADKTPGALVELPVLKDFEPNNNKNPQISDENGAYGFMVYPTTDYYLVAGKEGYEEYKSPTISVEQDLVKWDIQMIKASTGVNRLAGLNQVDTALAIAQATFPGKLNQVVLATADNYPDALAGSVLAYQLNAPILLVGSQEADQEKVMEYLNNSLNLTGEVYILGGTAVVSRDMEAKIQAGGFSRITRLAGIDRYETALKIAEHLGVKSGTPVILAYGESYPDALSVSSIAARMQSPIFLVPQDGLSGDIKEAIARIMPSKVYIIGGTAVVSPAVEAQAAELTSLDKTKIVRIGGQDAYETSLAVANYFNESGSSLCLATGNNFPDALTGSVYAAKHNAPIILVDSSLSNSFIEYIKTRKLRGMTLFGGTAVVNTGIEEQLRSLLEK
nr:InlB B-repeat-containing protein [Desulfosporosinus meridiei]